MGGGRSIFWKTREIGLPSYSKICTLWYTPTLHTPQTRIMEYWMFSPHSKESVMFFPNKWYGTGNGNDQLVWKNTNLLLIGIVNINYCEE
jgi:hypothetical protein